MQSKSLSDSLGSRKYTWTVLKLFFSVAGLRGKVLLDHSSLQTRIYCDARISSESVLLSVTMHSVVRQWAWFNAGRTEARQAVCWRNTIRYSKVIVHCVIVSAYGAHSWVFVRFDVAVNKPFISSTHKVSVAVENTTNTANCSRSLSTPRDDNVCLRDTDRYSLLVTDDWGSKVHPHDDCRQSVKWLRCWMSQWVAHSVS